MNAFAYVIDVSLLYIAYLNGCSVLSFYIGGYESCCLLPLLSTFWLPMWNACIWAHGMLVRCSATIDPSKILHHQSQFICPDLAHFLSPLLSPSDGDVGIFVSLLFTAERSQAAAWAHSYTNKPGPEEIQRKASKMKWKHKKEEPKTIWWAPRMQDSC